jgi:cytochrome b involved in lipid metabolism
LAIEEGGGGDTSNYVDYWRVLNGIISSMMFDGDHTNEMTSASRRQREQRRRGDGSNDRRYYTLNEVRTHNTMESAWVLVGDTIYDVTSYVSDHPGGTASILNKCGGIVDCTRDFDFHSKRARKEWKRHKVGILL